MWSFYSGGWSEFCVKGNCAASGEAGMAKKKSLVLTQGARGKGLSFAILVFNTGPLFPALDRST